MWRRFSDFKKLHQELSKIYVQKHAKEEEFPAFPKAKFFGRSLNDNNFGISLVHEHGCEGFMFWQD